MERARQAAITRVNIDFPLYTAACHSFSPPHKPIDGYKDIFISLNCMRLTLSIFRAVADPTRLRILGLLRAMELSVGELAQVLGQSQPRVSRHVKILIDARLAERRKEGSWVFLSLGDTARLAPPFAMLDTRADRGGQGPL